MLACTQDVTSATNFKIAHGDGIARAQLCILGNDFEALLTFYGRTQLAVAEEVGVGALRAAPDPAAQLVELRQAEGVGAVNDEGVGVGDVEPRLDDGGAEQQVGLAVHEGKHHPLQLVFLHLAVADGDPCLGHDAGQMLRHGADALHPVMDEEDLAAAAQLPQHRLPDQLVVEAGHRVTERAARILREIAMREGIGDRLNAYAGLVAILLVIFYLFYNINANPSFFLVF